MEALHVNCGEEIGCVYECLLNVFMFSNFVGRVRVKKNVGFKGKYQNATELGLVRQIVIFSFKICG